MGNENPPTVKAASDTITVLRCARGLRLAKMIRSTETVDYDSTRTFDGWSVPVSNLDDIGNLIGRLIEKPRFCIVRGELIDGPKAKAIRRLVHADPESGDTPTLRDLPRHWVALDVESVDRPDHILATDLEACARHAVQRLPISFREATCIVQATAGHGRKPDLRLRLWFWLSRATSGGELSRWLRGSPADPSVFRPAQIIYTAAPIFDGCEDHLPERIARLDGAETVTVPPPAALAPPEPRPAKPLPDQHSLSGSRYGRKALENAAAAVRNAPINTRHPTCLSQARGLARLVEAGLITASDVKDRLIEALVEAGKPSDEGEKLVAWALSHPSTASLPEGARP